MNSFTPAQLEVIKGLADAYWRYSYGIDQLAKDLPSVSEKSKQRYISSIVKGLTDPDYWGD